MAMAMLIYISQFYDEELQILRMWSHETFREGDDNCADLENIRLEHEETSRPGMQLEELLVRMQVVKKYLRDQHEHMVMIEQLKDLMNESFLGRKKETLELMPFH